MSLTIGSLFAGVGGLDLGLEWAGLGPVLWQVEKEPFCRDVLAKHWPAAVRHDDVRSAGPDVLAPVDLICGGFPCVDISNAGRHAGMAGDRSGPMWREFARIISDLRPRFVVVENVAALAGRGLGDVLGDLAACGFDAWWDCLPAQAVRAPHARDRLFIVAHARAPRRQGLHKAVHGEHLQPTPGALRRQRQSEPRVARGADGLSGGLDGRWPAGPDAAPHAWEPPRIATTPRRHDAARRRALGNAVSPVIGYVVGCVVRALAEAAS